VKVNDTTPLAPVRSLRPAEQTQQVNSAKDKISTNEQERVSTVTSEAQELASKERSVRLQELEAQVQSGSYKPDAGRIAEQILAEAELNARIRSLLN
jgi:anti-sigma28 factor (negative regulator of flagellin synthesis)